MKVCSRCGVEKSLSEFYVNKGRLMAKCKKCHGEVAANWAKNNPEKRKLIDQRHAAKKKLTRYQREYGIDAAELMAMQSGSQGKCCICHEFKGDDLDVDHDHSTGQVRGLLCRNCNRALGYFGDDADTVLRAAYYLLRSRDYAVTAEPD